MSDTFLNKYISMMKSYETPEIYDLWAAMTTLSAVVSRKIWFDLGEIRIFPSLFVVLVGPPGARKNTAMNLPQEMLEALEVNMIQGAVTKEKLVEFMSKECKRTFLDPVLGVETEYTPLTIFSNELTHFLGTDPIKAIHMVDFLTIIYDKVGDYDASTITRGENIVPKPSLTIFSATTPSNISRYLKEEALSGGMARRTVFVNANRAKTPIAIPIVSEETKQSKAWCFTYLEKVSKIIGPFTLPKPSQDWYTKWYAEVFERVQRETNDLIGGYLSSKHIQMFKLAMLISINRDPDQKEILIEDMELADALLTKIEKELPIVYEGLGVNEQASVARRIKEAVVAAGGEMPDRELKRIFYKDSKDLLKIFEHLQDTQELICGVQRNPDGSVRNRTWFLPSHPKAVEAREAALKTSAETSTAALERPAPQPAVTPSPNSERLVAPKPVPGASPDQSW